MAPTHPRLAARSSSAATAFGAAIGRVDRARRRVGCRRTASTAMSFASRLSATDSAAASGPVPGGAMPRIWMSIPCSSMLAMRPWPTSSSLASLSPISLNARLASRSPSGKRLSAAVSSGVVQCSSIPITAARSGFMTRKGNVVRWFGKARRAHFIRASYAMSRRRSVRSRPSVPCGRSRLWGLAGEDALPVHAW